MDCRADGGGTIFLQQDTGIQLNNPARNTALLCCLRIKNQRNLSIQTFIDTVHPGMCQKYRGSLQNFNLIDLRLNCKMARAFS